jgi:DNA mismatch repair protein MutL
MGTIQVLSDLLANKIAAGEVVERPASVIKELLENAIDAESTQIIVEIEQGGLDLIKVADNGIGMESEDALTAFERHATSKIKSEKDLFRIRTLGFRGEALPSIASVSKTEVRTRTREANEGTLVKIDGGHLVTHGVTAAKKGTEIAVRDLFFNTPARLKYLKSIQTELGHMIDVVNRQALAHPGISFRMFHNGRQILQTPGDGKLLHAIAAIYGSDMARQMLPIEWEDYDYKIVGAVGFPELNRANRNHCTFLVNGRFVRSYQLLNAVQAAYHTRLPINRYPVCVIALELDPSLVDVNVHPNKLEVRFSEEKDVAHAVQRAVQEALQVQTFIPKASAKSFAQEEPKEKSQQNAFDFSAGARGADVGTGSASSERPAPYRQGVNGPAYKEPLPQGGSVVRETPLSAQYTTRREKGDADNPSRQHIEAAMGAYQSMAMPLKEQADASVQDRAGSGGATSGPREGAGAEATGLPPHDPAAEAPQGDFASGVAALAALAAGLTETTFADAASSAAPAVSQPVEPQTAAPEPAEPSSRVPQFRPIVQALGMYVIAQDETGLYIIDQHAAHEKVLFEKFSRRLVDRDVRPLSLLVPLTLELTAAEAAQLEQKIELLGEMAIEVEQFGGTTFLIRSVPDIWEGLEIQSLLQELIDELLQEGGGQNPRALIESKVIMKACKSAIKANQWLSMPEMVALCDQLRELDNPFNCPHGRPIIIHMSNYDLEKQFKRVM